MNTLISFISQCWHSAPIAPCCRALALLMKVELVGGLIVNVAMLKKGLGIVHFVDTQTTHSSIVNYRQSLFIKAKTLM